jgi:hypothetical protein
VEERLESVVDFAKTKLTPPAAKPSTVDRSDVPEAHLAWLSWLVMIQFAQESAAAQELESRLVESYMRVVHVIPASRAYLRSGTPSDPIVVEAAAQLLNHHSCNIPGILAHALSTGLVAHSERVQMIGRALLIQASLRTAQAMSPLHGCLHYHRPIRVLDFLEQLFAPSVFQAILAFKPMAFDDDDDDDAPSLEHAFGKAWVHFSHFGLAGDDKIFNRGSLPNLMLRGVALQSYDSRAEISGAVGVLFDEDDTSGPCAALCKANVSALQWKIDHFSAPSFSTLPLSYVDPDGKADGRSILSLSLSLGEANASGTTNDRVFRPVEGGTSRNQTAQKRHYQINVRGLEAYRVWTEADRSAIRTALAMPYDVDFGRKDQPQNARLLEQCLPALTTRIADAQCASS